MLEGVVGQGDATVRPERAGQAALLVGQRAPDDRADVLVGQRLEPPDPHPRQERGVDLEVRVLGGRPDERDGAVLDVREERVLLGLVEAVDLVEEEDGPRAVEGEPVLGLGDRRADLGDARHDRRQRREVGADLRGEQAGEARLARARRAPQQERREVAAGDAAAQRPALADEVLLADELGRGRAAASGPPAAAARAVAGTGLRVGRRSVAGGTAWPRW